MQFDACGPLRGRLHVPADKSISHRAAILAAMGSEPARIRNYLRAADTSSTLAAIRKLGASVDADRRGVVVRGRRLDRAETAEIDVGNAGSLMRLLPGWLASNDGRSYQLDGDDSIRRRPVDRIAEPAGAHGRAHRRAPGPILGLHRIRGATERGSTTNSWWRPGQVMRTTGGTGDTLHNGDRAGARA